MDTSNFNVFVPKVPAGLKDRIVGLVTRYTGGNLHYHEEITDTSIEIGANAVWVGSVDDLDTDFTALIAETGQDFAYSINDEPVYEYLGTIVIHVPGRENFASSCDADGNVVLNNYELMRLVDDATDLDGLRADIRRATGVEQFEAMRAWEASS